MSDQMSDQEDKAMKNETTLTCIGCPMGCVMVVSADQRDNLTVVGAKCARGEAYARSEVIRPTRIITTLIAVSGCKTPLSVKTSQPVPRELIGAVLDAIHTAKVLLPVARGDVIIADLLGTGSDVVATRSLRPLGPDEASQPI